VPPPWPFAHMLGELYHTLILHWSASSPVALQCSMRQMYLTEPLVRAPDQVETALTTRDFQFTTVTDLVGARGAPASRCCAVHTVHSYVGTAAHSALAGWPQENEGSSVRLRAPDAE
jgi:hypothetical protein